MSFNLLALTHEPYEASTRYRVAQFVPYLKKSGVDVQLVPWPRADKERRALLDSARMYDAVLVQKRLLSRQHTLSLRRNARWLAYDFDDAIVRQNSALGRPWLLLDKVWRFHWLVSRCDAITSGNAYLAELAATHAKRNTVRVVPTVLEAWRYKRPAELRSTVTPVLGWIGQQSTRPYLERLEQPLRELARRRPGLLLRCIADAAPRIQGVAVEFCPWDSEHEATRLHGLTIGLAPLPNDRWTLGKCGLRLLQYLAAGVPAIASPVGVQAQVISSGAALPATSDSDWVDAAERLLNDSSLRASLVKSGHELVEHHYVPSAWVSTLLHAWCGMSSAAVESRAA